MIIYECSFCKYQTDKPANFEKHMNKVNNCASNKPKKITPESHDKYIKKGGEYLCTYCNKIFKHYSSLNRHILHRCKKK